MQEYSITNFKFGLDTRRDVLTSQPGTMVTCENAFITPGGEVEKRMKFEQYSDMSILDVDGFQACFGLENTVYGLTTYSHVRSFSGGVLSTNNQVLYTGSANGLTTSASVIPTGVTVIRIYHPALVFGSYTGTSYDSAKHRLTAVNSSTSFLGRGIIVATFADGSQAMYDHGDLIIQSAAGEAYSYTTQAAINTALRYQLLHCLTRFTDWSGDGNSTTPTAQPSVSGAYIYTPAGQTFSAAVCTMDSTAGLFSVYNSSGSVAAADWSGSATPAGTTTITVADADTGESFDIAKSTSGTVANCTAVANQVSGATHVTAVDSGATVTLTMPFYSAAFPAYILLFGTTKTAPTVVVNGGAPTSMTGGALGYGDKAFVCFYNTWVAGDTWTLSATVNGIDFTLGAGNLYPKSLGKLFSFRNRVYVANDTQFNFSAVDDVTGWEEQDTGAGFITYNSQYGSNDVVKSFAAYQGQLAVIGGRTIQMWTASANPASFALNQVLDNIGTVASNSVASIGELETLFLHDTGIRSLRARETTLNAYVNDIGSAIDSIVQGVLAGLTSTQKETACAIVDPITSRYWLYLSGTIYALNYFPSSKIIAWSTILPTYEAFATITGSGTYSAGGIVTLTTVAGTAYKWVKAGAATHIVNGTETITSSGYFVAQGTSVVENGNPLSARTSTLQSSIQTSFTPSKFTISGGRIYVLTTTGIVYIYGGDAGGEYDNAIATVELPWMDMGSPSTTKQAHGVDAAFKGKWLVSASMNPQASNQITVINKGSATSPNMALDSTYDTGHYPFSAQGTHVKLKAVTSATLVSSAKLGMMTLLYEKQNKK